ncbi:mitochondrial glycine transporter-like isoform X2 [Oscarella lobularis]|uniref:mitochondrial glycine transporter-like isoform X2 n=1 Tax=Oscarella lobularis TaxID=121494 RepID=UPI00331426C3
MSRSQNSLAISFMGGSVSGLCSAVLLQPLDVVKTRLQLISRDEALPKSGMRGVIVSILRHENPLALWKGLVPSLYRVVPGIGIYFCALNFLQNSLSLHRPSLYQSLVMGASARTCACLILHPFTVLKTRLESGKFRYKSVPGGIKLVIKAEGLPGLYAGLGPTMVRDVPFSALYLMFYNRIKTAIKSNTDSLPSLVNFSSGLVSGILASIVTHPADVLKTRLQTETSHRLTSFQTIYIIISREGLLAFYKGLLPRIVRRTATASISWTIYEEITSKLS